MQIGVAVSVEMGARAGPRSAFCHGSKDGDCGFGATRAGDGRPTTRLAGPGRRGAKGRRRRFQAAGVGLTTNALPTISISESPGIQSTAMQARDGALPGLKYVP